MAIPIVAPQHKNEIISLMQRLLELLAYPKIPHLQRLAIAEHLNAMRITTQDMQVQLTMQTSGDGLRTVLQLDCNFSRNQTNDPAHSN